MLVLAKIFLGLRLEWDFFVHEGTILLFYNIPGSIGPVDLSRFGWSSNVSSVRFCPFLRQPLICRLMTCIYLCQWKEKSRVVGQTAFKFCGRSVTFLHLVDMASRTWAGSFIFTSYMFRQMFHYMFYHPFHMSFRFQHTSILCFIQQHPYSYLPDSLHRILLCVSYIFNPQLQIYKPVVLCRYSLVYTL
jgi:hypothetical protein